MPYKGDAGRDRGNVTDLIRHTHIYIRRSRMTALINTTNTIGLHKLSGWLKGISESLADRAKVRATIKELNCLSDAELHDIGIHRSQIRSVAEGTNNG